jgi:hypothetical protein
MMPAKEQCCRSLVDKTFAHPQAGNEANEQIGIVAKVLEGYAEEVDRATAATREPT